MFEREAYEKSLLLQFSVVCCEFSIFSVALTFLVNFSIFLYMNCIERYCVQSYAKYLTLFD